MLVQVSVIIIADIQVVESKCNSNGYGYSYGYGIRYLQVGRVAVGLCQTLWSV